MTKNGRMKSLVFCFEHVNKYKINIFPVVTNMTKMEYNNSQKGQILCSIFHKVSMVSIVGTSIIRSVKSKRNRLYDQLGEIAMKRHTRKIAIIGTGLVGSSCAYSIVNQGICEELLLIDINHERAVGEAMDLSHCINFTNTRTKVYAGSYEDCKDMDIVIITAASTKTWTKSLRYFRSECEDYGKCCWRRNGKWI